MNLVCRTCLQMDKKFFNIFEHFDNNKLISDLLMECVPVKVQKHDKLPLHICSNCLEKLRSICDFKIMAIESDMKLRKFYYKNAMQNDLRTCADTVKTEILLVKFENDDNPNDNSDCKGLNIPMEKKDLISVDNSGEKCISSISIDHVDYDNVNFVQNKFSLNDENEELMTTECESEDADSVDNSFCSRQQIQISTEDEVKQKNFSRNSCTSESTGGITNSKKSTMENDNNLPASKEECRSFNSSDDENNSTFRIKLPVREEGRKITRREKEGMSVFCKQCNRSFGYRYYFEVHVRHHTGDKPFKCDVCDKSFAKRFQLNLHNSIHTDERPFSCEICDKTFRIPSGLQTHMAVHSENRPYKCDLCEKSFKHENTLKIHLGKHRNEKKYVCEICGKSFADNSGLYNHIPTHVLEKKFSCLTCGKTFSSNRRMRRHFKQHTDEKPHMCSFCGKRFKDKKVMETHVYIHTGEKPYSCNICGKTFRQAACIPRHMRIHTGETPYPCELCPSKFKYSHHLLNHMKVHK